MSDIAKNLEAAADLIEDAGYVTGTEGMHGRTGFCALGAIYRVVIGRPDEYDSDPDRKYYLAEQTPEAKRLAQVLDLRSTYGAGDDPGNLSCIWRWSDRSGKDAVVEGLRRAAQTD